MAAHTLLRLQSSSLVVSLSRVSKEQGEAAPVPSAGHMLPAVQLPVALWEWVSRWNMTSGFQPGMHHVPTTSLYALPCFVAVHCNLSISWHLGAELGVSSEDERDAIKHIMFAEPWWKIKVCSHLAGVAPLHCADSAELGVGGGTTWVQTLGLLTVWGCWGQQDYIIKNTNTSD